MTSEELQERINIMANSSDWRRAAFEIADEAERLMKENAIMREALANLANPNAYENENIDFYEPTIDGLKFNGRSPHEFAQAILSRLEER